MAKLLREARDLKEQLSAGAIGSIQVEEIYEGIDFATTLTREKFEDLTRSLIRRVLQPLHELYEKSGEVLRNVNVVELYGGGVRVPAIQTAISAEFKSLTTLGKHIDGDEAAAFGAGHYAAVLNAVPTTKKIQLDDDVTPTAGESASELSESAISSLRETLQRFDELAKTRIINMEARNKLESFLIELKDKRETLGNKMSDDEQEQLSGLISKTQDYLDYETSKSTGATEYISKFNALKSSADPLLQTAIEKWAKEQAKAKAKEDAEEKKRSTSDAARARERAQDKAYARKQAAREQQSTKTKAAGGTGTGAGTGANAKDTKQKPKPKTEL